MFKVELKELRAFRKRSRMKNRPSAQSNSVSSSANSKLYAADLGFNDWDLLDSGADMSVRRNPLNRSWETKNNISTAERGRQVRVTHWSEHSVPSTLQQASHYKLWSRIKFVAISHLLASYVILERVLKSICMPRVRSSIHVVLSPFPRTSVL